MRSPFQIPLEEQTFRSAACELGKKNGETWIHSMVSPGRDRCFHWGDIFGMRKYGFKLIRMAFVAIAFYAHRTLGTPLA